jgi:Glycosyl-4,4'-diaponeurosporenoate acyltransferase
LAVTVAAQVLLVVTDILVILVISIGVGSLAPRWPDSWLDGDPVPLALGRWETPAFYRGLGIARLARRLPELGDTFGGESKSQLPGGTREHLIAYRREVRRAEWVHWASVAGSLLLFAFNPWWLALVFVMAVTAGNLPFILVLRNNRVRITRIIDRDGGR